MTNKPMLSVDLELIERIVRPQLKARDETVRRRAISELRELLYRPAAHSDPVAWSLEVEGYTTVLYENYQKALSEQEHFRGRGRTAEIYPLHREQSVSVAVMPGVDDLSNIIRKVDGSHTLGAGALAESILAEVSRINRMKP